MDFKNRMKYAIAYLKAQNIIVSQNEMGQILGYKESSFSQIINGRVPFSKNMINKIKLNFPQLNTKWLLTGEGEMLNHSHNGTTHNTQKNNGGDNIYINNTGGSISNSGNKTGQDKENAGQCNEIKEMTKLLNQLHETKIIEIDRLTKLYNGIISNQNEFIDTLKEQNSQYRKEIESLRQRIKGNNENNKE